MENKQKEKLKKLLVFGGLSLLFTLSIWFIFTPSKKEKRASSLGLNKNIPQATTEKLTENKLKAYELGERTTEEEQRRTEMGRLSDYFNPTNTSSEAKQQESITSDKIETSILRYKENSHLLNTFYDPSPYEEEQEAMRAEIEALKKELSEQNYHEEHEEAKQLALMEKSYQMAAKYLPMVTTSQIPSNTFTPNQEQPITENQTHTNLNSFAEPTMEVLPEQKQVVSSLNHPINKAEIINNYETKKHNLGFHSLNEPTIATVSNTLRVVVDKTTTLKEGDYVALRLMETVRIKDLRIPKQSKLFAQAKIEGNRMHLHIKSLEVDGQIMFVKLSAYDLDGLEGIYIPGSDERTTFKEIGANIGGSMGTSFTFASSAKDQIISEATRGVMQGANQLFQKKLRTLKVTLKSGYHLFLIQTK